VKSPLANVEYAVAVGKYAVAGRSNRVASVKYVVAEVENEVAVK
jgi:hypothetical protein